MQSFTEVFTVRVSDDNDGDVRNLKVTLKVYAYNVHINGDVYKRNMAFLCHPKIVFVFLGEITVLSTTGKSLPCKSISQSTMKMSKL